LSTPISVKADIPRKRTEKLTEALLRQWSDQPEAKEYIRLQWAALLLRAERKGDAAQHFFYFGRWLIVVGAAIVPTLVILGAQTHGTVATMISLKLPLLV
jgi:hypothetical protein